MQATLLPIDFEAELRAVQRRRIEGRSSGVHLSDIIHYIMDEIEAGRYGDGPIDPALAHGGFLWEDVTSNVLAKHLGLNKQIELFIDGVYMTLDGFNTKDWRVVECKDTKISAANPIRGRKFWHWHMQIMAYCRAMRATEAELYVRHVNGSYELGGGRFGKTVVKPWLFRFTPRELEENWDGVLRWRDDMEEAA